MSVQLWLAKSAFGSIRQDFYDDLAEALDDKAQLARRIEILAERAVTEKDLVAPLFQLWVRRLDDGSFSEALAGTVPDSDVMILSAAERSGRLSDGLRFAVKVIESSKEMKGSLKSACVGFIFSTTFLVALLIGFAYYGIPLIEEVVPPAQWPWIGQQLRGLAQFILSWGGATAIGFVGIGILYAWSLPNWRGRARVLVDRYVPFYRIYRDFNAAMFLVSLAALMRNKVSLFTALETLEERASPWLKWHITQIDLLLDYHPEEPGRAFNTGLFNRQLTWRIIDFGERDDFDLAIEKVGLKSIDSVIAIVKASAKSINSLLTIISGGLLAFIILGTLATVYEAQSTVQQQIKSSSTIK